MRGSKSQYTRFSRGARPLKVALTLFYLIAAPLYLYLAFQPASAVDEASENAVASLEISSISLDTPVVPSAVENKTLTVPDRVAGVYSEFASKILLIGHSSTVFSELKNVALGDDITYAEKTYRVTDIVEQPKRFISMQAVLAPAERETLVLMTCAGQPLGGDDYTHRLIITAELEN